MVDLEMLVREDRHFFYPKNQFFIAFFQFFICDTVDLLEPIFSTNSC